MKPGATGGVKSLVYQYNPGDPAYNQDWGSVSPSFGFAWTPSAKGPLLGRILGESGQTVLRGGFGIAFHRNSMGTYNDIFSGNVGGSIGASRTQDLGQPGSSGESYPLLFREKSRLGPPPFTKEPVYPAQGRDSRIPSGRSIPTSGCRTRCRGRSAFSARSRRTRRSRSAMSATNRCRCGRTSTTTRPNTTCWRTAG